MRSDLPRLYNQTDSPVDPQSADFRNVMEYLAALGLPAPQIIQQEVGIPTGIRYVDTELVYTNPSRPPLKMQAFLVMNAPQRAVTDFDVWMGEKKPRIPDEYTPPKPDPAKPVVVAKPPAKPGALMYGNIYYPVAGDDSPDGTKWEIFTKHVVPSPFGSSVYWTKGS